MVARKVTRKIGHRFGRSPELGILVVCTVQHALNVRCSRHPDSKRQRKARLLDLSRYGFRMLKSNSAIS